MLGPYHVLRALPGGAPELFGSYPTLDIARRRAELLLRDRPYLTVAVTLELAAGATAPGLNAAFVPTADACAAWQQISAARDAAAQELISDTYPTRDE